MPQPPGATNPTRLLARRLAGQPVCTAAFPGWLTDLGPAMAKKPSSTNLGGDDLRLAQLTASRSLVRKDRREGRHDVLVNTVVAILAERHSLSETQLIAVLRRTWQTSTLSDEMVSTALADARRAGLIAIPPDKHGATKYVVTGHAASHNSQDRQYAQGLVSAFKSNIADRLTDYPNEKQLALIVHENW